MIQSIINIPYVLPSNDSVLTFNNDDIRTKGATCCGWLQHTSGSPLYKILKGGKYKVTFTGTIASATAGTVALGLYVDGVLIPDTIRSVTLAATYLGDISFTKELSVCCKGDSTITIRAVPTVLTAASTTPVTTQVPTIEYGTLLIEKDS